MFWNELVFLLGTLGAGDGRYLDRVHVTSQFLRNLTIVKVLQDFEEVDMFHSECG